ncbi:MAG: hypothetical protein OEV94_10650 [Deltaproteobacteria bacterium]|nr:hypothetical protein [Deltaproteobacteria bacterium]
MFWQFLLFSLWAGVTFKLSVILTVYSFSVMAVSVLIWKKTPWTNKNNILELLLIHAALAYGVMMVIYQLYYGYIEYRLYQFDLNGDEIFSPEEQTPEQQRLFAALINDARVAFWVLFLGPVFTIVSTLVLLASVKLYGKFSLPPRTENEMLQ